MSLNLKAHTAISTLSHHEAAYCARIASRLERMGLADQVISEGICNLVEEEAIPQPGYFVKFPSLNKLRASSTSEHAIETEVAFA